MDDVCAMMSDVSIDSFNKYALQNQIVEILQSISHEEIMNTQKIDHFQNIDIGNLKLINKFLEKINNRLSNAIQSNESIIQVYS